MGNGRRVLWSRLTRPIGSAHLPTLGSADTIKYVLAGAPAVRCLFFGGP